MAQEIERKFLLKNNNWKMEVSSSCYFNQGYLNQTEDRDNVKSSVRVRIEGDKANINIKSMTLSISRQEYEYSIPLDDATKMLDELCLKPLIEKNRHLVYRDGNKWEIDVFEGDNKGLVIAEIELDYEQAEFVKPDWLGAEVSEQQKYYNVCLVKHPYTHW